VYLLRKHPEFNFLNYTLFQTSTGLVFKTVARSPETIPVHAKDHVWQIDTNAIGEKQLCPAFGRDIGRDRDYYYPVTREGAFEAPKEGIYSFSLYMWVRKD
jgi:hypothetical protein